MSDLYVEAKEIFDSYIEKDFKEWIEEELKNAAQKTDNIAKVTIQLKWKAPIWEQKYIENGKEQFLVNDTRSYKTLLDVVTDDGIGIKVNGDSVQLPKRPLDNIKTYLHYLYGAESFSMSITASTLGKNNAVINTKEWMYNRPA